MRGHLHRIVDFVHHLLSPRWYWRMSVPGRTNLLAVLFVLQVTVVGIGELRGRTLWGVPNEAVLAALAAYFCWAMWQLHFHARSVYGCRDRNCQDCRNRRPGGGR